MGRAIEVRTDYTSGELRWLAQRTKNSAQARRLLAIAAVLDGASREAAAKIGGMDRQTLRDWVIRFNERGPDGLINIPSPGVPPKLDEEHRAFLARIVEEGPIPAVHGVVRWRACDLIMRLHEEFGLSVSDDTIYRALKDLGFSHLSARPKAYKQDAEAMDASKKLCRTRGGSPRETRARHTGRSLVPGRDAGRPEEQAQLSLGQKRLTSPGHPRSTHPINLSIRCGMPRTRNRSRPRAASVQHRGYAASSRRDRHEGHPRRSRRSHPRSSRLAWRKRPRGSKKYLAPAVAAASTRAQQSRKHLAVHASELAVEQNLQILRRHRRSLLLRLEYAHRPALENHVHRPPRLGGRRSIIVSIGIRGSSPLERS